MKNNSGISVTQLKNVPELLLYTLLLRYLESKKENGIINDPKSIEILESLNFDFSKIKPKVLERIAGPCRSLIFDEQTIIFIAKYPDAVIVNLGCGLDTRFYRIDNGQLFWFDLDLPECIEIKKEFFEETDRYRFISQSAFDFSWTAKIPKNKKVLFLAEGLTMYFKEAEIKALLTTIKNNFPGAEFLFDAFHPLLVKMNKKIPQGDLSAKLAPLVKWGINKGQDFNSWFNENIFLSEWCIADKHTEKYPLFFKIMFFIFPITRKLNKVIQLRF